MLITIPSNVWYMEKFFKPYKQAVKNVIQEMLDTNIVIKIPEPFFKKLCDLINV
tara:strand:+ start:218 stop:379 length:162 start_codon:yes stop_codon:yes gene_type:complete